jgi:hypothetical protein
MHRHCAVQLMGPKTMNLAFSPTSSGVNRDKFGC